MPNLSQPPLLVMLMETLQFLQTHQRLTLYSYLDNLAHWWYSS
jgi:hypothetical protein